MVDWDDLAGGLWVGLRGRRLDGVGGSDAAEVASRQNILSASEADLERKRARDRAPAPVMRWRHHLGAWQRWSQLDADFATMEPPGTLLEHVAATGLPADDEELVFVDGAWRVADDHLGSDPAPAGAAEPPTPDLPSAPSPPEEPPAAAAAAAYEAQLEAWRQRARS